MFICRLSLFHSCWGINVHAFLRPMSKQDETAWQVDKDMQKHSRQVLCCSNCPLCFCNFSLTFHSVMSCLAEYQLEQQTYSFAQASISSSFSLWLCLMVLYCSIKRAAVIRTLTLAHCRVTRCLSVVSLKYSYSLNSALTTHDSTNFLI